MKRDKAAKVRKANRKKWIRKLRKLRKKAKQERRLKELLKQYGTDILKSDNFQKSEKNIQHGNVSVMRHSISVAKHSLLLAKHLGIRCNKRDLIRGALLHDYFLYDWHSAEHCGLHNPVSYTHLRAHETSV